MSDAAAVTPSIGPYIDSAEFWAAIAEGKLKLQYCRDAGRFQHYPRPLSVFTGRRNLEWREVSGLGTIYAVTVMQVPGLGYVGKPPYCVATVELDEGVRIIARILNVAPDAVRAGGRVRLTWEQIGESPYPAFEPIPEPT
jgi:uncharacterized OB-fold protein